MEEGVRLVTMNPGKAKTETKVCKHCKDEKPVKEFQAGFTCRKCASRLSGERKARKKIEYELYRIA